MAAFIANTVATVLVGVALWAFLPRGVALTKTRRPGDADISRPPEAESFAARESWAIRNDSALPILVLGVTYHGINTTTPDGIEVRSLPLSSPGDFGISLTFDDLSKAMEQEVSDGSWDDQVISPGDSLSAFVNLNRTLTIRYRRKGWTGVLERRQLQIVIGV